uniref:Uncharacterized protein n=1 Tax=Parascaris equorum TaxID=6256 RepID=A0A914RQR5_PAREQ
MYAVMCKKVKQQGYSVPRNVLVTMANWAISQRRCVHRH